MLLLCATYHTWDMLRSQMGKVSHFGKTNFVALFGFFCPQTSYQKFVRVREEIDVYCLNTVWWVSIFTPGGENSCSFICRADSILTTFPFHNCHFSGPQWNLLPFNGAFLNRGLTSQSPVTVATHAWLMIYHTQHRTGLQVRKRQECKQVED